MNELTQAIDFSKPRAETASKETKAADKLLKKGETVSKKDVSKQNVNDEDKPVSFDEIMKAGAVEAVSVNQVKKIYPKKMTEDVAVEVTRQLNLAAQEMDAHGLGQFFKETSLGFLDILKDNKTNTHQEYINAAKFVTFTTSGDTKVLAYCKTFPDRVKRMEEEGTPSSYLATYAKSFSNSQLVTKLTAKMMIPYHVLYQDVFNQAVKTQAEIMIDNKISSRDRTYAANSLMTHLKPPETKETQLDITTTQSSAIGDLASALNSLAQAQHENIKNGHQTIIDVTKQAIYKEVEHED